MTNHMRQCGIKLACYSSNAICRIWSVALSTASESTVFGLPDLIWSARLCQSEQNFLNYLVTVLRSTTLLLFAQQMFFGCFHGVVALFELVNNKFTETKLQVYLWHFKIPYGTIKFSACKRTNYHNTTDRSCYLSRSRDIYATFLQIPEYCKIFYSLL